MNSENVINNVEFLAALFGVLGVFAALAGWAIKHWMLDIMSERLEKRIDERTYPIQPHANGGKSLPDVFKSLDRIQVHIDKVEERQLDHLEWHSTHKAS